MARPHIPPTDAEYVAHVVEGDGQGLGYRAAGQHFWESLGGADSGYTLTQVQRRCKTLASKYADQRPGDNLRSTGTRRQAPRPAPAHYTDPAPDVTGRLDGLHYVRDRLLMSIAAATPGQLSFLVGQYRATLAEIDELTPDDADAEVVLTTEERHAQLRDHAHEAPLDDLEVIVRVYLDRTNTALMNRPDNVIALEDRAKGGSE